MNIVVVTPPPVEPVTAGEAFFQLKLTTDPDANVSGEPEYGEVMRKVKSAREQCEQITRRAFVQQTLRLERGPIRGTERRGLLWYMNGAGSDWGSVELLRPPLISVASVKYFDDANVMQTIAPESYFVPSGLVSRIQFVNGFDAPSTYLREDAIQIEYVAGYPVVPGDPEADPVTEDDYRANVPASIKSAILLETQLQYDLLSPAERQAIERARDSLLSSFRITTL